jgi:hypothetical protein
MVGTSSEPPDRLRIPARHDAVKQKAPVRAPQSPYAFAKFRPRVAEDMMRDEVEVRDESNRKEYFPPKIVHTEKIEGRAVACSQADDATCGAGPIQS